MLSVPVFIHINTQNYVLLFPQIVKVHMPQSLPSYQKSSFSDEEDVMKQSIKIQIRHWQNETFPQCAFVMRYYTKINHLLQYYRAIIMCVSIKFFANEFYYHILQLWHILKTVGCKFKTYRIFLLFLSHVPISI